MTQRLALARRISTIWLTCAITAALACTPASTRHRTSSPLTCRRRWPEVRLETYQHYAQPAAFGSLYRRVGMTTVLALVGGLIIFLLLAMGLKARCFIRRWQATSTRYSP